MRLCFLFFILYLSTALAQDRTTAVPYRLIVHLAERPQPMKKLQKARIALLDYDLLRLDFPFLKEMTNAQVDDWVLSQVAYMSPGQVEQTVVNTPIPITDESRLAYRPKDYGRAVAYEVQDPSGQSAGIIDAKGAGAIRPSQTSHGNGLATLGEAIREYNYENLVRGILVDSGLPNRTVGSYGVIDAGFDIIHADGNRSRAGIYLRQGHRRSQLANLLSKKEIKLFSEVLGRYGIDVEGNVQGTIKSDLYDFGHYVVNDDPALNRDPAKAVSFEDWGFDKSIPNPQKEKWFYAKHDKAWIRAHEVADAFARGRATREDVWRLHVEMVGPQLQRLTSCRSGFLHILNALMRN